MNNEKLNINLQGIPQTLLLPLLGRALFSQKPYSPLHDERAIELINTINYDFEKLHSKAKHATLYWMTRAYHFDKAIKEYLRTNPDGIVVNLGAGLETAFYRLDNEKLTWIDLDLPEVISLREKLFSSTERNHNVSKSILDYTWMDEIKKFGNEFFFFAGGFFMYFTEPQVKSLLCEMATRFPNSELIFDSITSNSMIHANKMLKSANMSNAILQWAIDDASILETWHSHIKILSRSSYFKEMKYKPGFPLNLRAKMFISDLFDKNGIIHLKFC